jgi:hypothetical protein
LIERPPALALTNRLELWAWAKSHGIDAAAITDQTTPGLLGYELAVVQPLVESVWDTLTAPEALANDMLKHGGSPGTPVFLSAKGNLPETFLFKTREGSVGLLQITGFNKSQPRKVKIRYKLVQNAVAKPIITPSPAPATAATAANLSFGPVIEREISSDQVHWTNWWGLNLASGKVMRFDLTRPPDDATNWFAATDFSSALTHDRRLPSLRAAGVDLFQAVAASEPDSVLALDMRLVSLDADGWSLSAVDAMAQLDKSAALGVSRSEVLIGGSHVYVFSTRNGAKGVLEISKNTSPAKLRYRLVKTSSKTARGEK